MRGRPKTLTYEQREENRLNAMRRYQKVNKEKFDNAIKNYRTKNREQINNKQRERYKKANEHKKDPFYNGEDNPIISERKRAILIRIADMMRVGCVEKKSKGFNYLAITGKKSINYMMNVIGYTDVEDFWISRSWSNIPMKILGWKDIKKCRVNFNKMIAYGVLIKKGISKDIVLKIIEYMDH